MAAIDTAAFRERLLALRASLQDEANSAKSATDTVSLDQTRVGRLSRMDAMQAQQMALEAARRRAAMLAKIEGALRRLDADEFGDCFRCGEPIDQRRLAFDPTSTRCMTCMEEA